MARKRPSKAEMRRTLDAFLLEVDEPEATDQRRTDERTPTAKPDARRDAETNERPSNRCNAATSGLEALPTAGDKRTL